MGRGKVFLPYSGQNTGYVGRGRGITLAGGFGLCYGWRGHGRVEVKFSIEGFQVHLVHSGSREGFNCREVAACK